MEQQFNQIDWYSSSQERSLSLELKRRGYWAEAFFRQGVNGHYVITDAPIDALQSAFDDIRMLIPEDIRPFAEPKPITLSDSSHAYKLWAEFRASNQAKAEGERS